MSQLIRFAQDLVLHFRPNAATSDFNSLLGSEIHMHSLNFF